MLPYSLSLMFRLNQTESAIFMEFCCDKCFRGITFLPFEHKYLDTSFGNNDPESHKLNAFKISEVLFLHSYNCEHISLYTPKNIVVIVILLHLKKLNSNTDGVNNVFF
jgi:hypothetical protein